MANTIAGLGRFDTQQSAAGKSYLDVVKKSGEEFAALGEGMVKYRAELDRREAEARSLIPEADFSSDTAVSGMYAADAKQIEDRVNGDAEDSYNFADLNDIARFKKDVAKLNKEITQGEEIYTQSVKDLTLLDQQHSLYVQAGSNARKAPSQKLEGYGEVYNSNVEEDNFQRIVGGTNVLRNSNITKEGGKYVLRDADTNQVLSEYNTKEEYLQDLADLSRPNLQPVPVMTPREYVIENKLGRQYSERFRAKDSFTNAVKGELDTDAKRFYAEQEGISMDAVTGDVGEDGLTNYQRVYRDQMLREWQDEQTLPSDSTKKSDESTTKRQSNLTGFRQGDDNQYTIEDGLIAQVQGRTEEGEQPKLIDVEIIALNKPVKLEGSTFAGTGDIEIFGGGINPVNGKMLVRIQRKKKETKYKVTDSDGEFKIYSTLDEANANKGRYDLVETEEVTTVTPENIEFYPQGSERRDTLKGQNLEIFNAIQRDVPELYSAYSILAAQQRKAEYNRKYSNK